MKTPKITFLSPNEIFNLVEQEQKAGMLDDPEMPWANMDAHEFLVAIHSAFRSANINYFERLILNEIFYENKKQSDVEWFAYVGLRMTRERICMMKNRALRRIRKDFPYLRNYLAK